MPRKRKPAVAAGRDTYHVLGPRGELATKGEAPHALVTAQGLAERSDGEVTLTVTRRSLFGPEAQLYRVVRGEHGIVTTITVNAED